MNKKTYIKDLTKALGNSIEIGIEHSESPCIYVRKDSLSKVIDYLKNHIKTQYTQLISICGVDYPRRDRRIEVVYNLLSIKWNSRLLVKVCVEEGESVDSITNYYSGAQWYEREVWDMYGVYFNKNEDLRRILTDYGFEGHPLRKDFPLSGYVEWRYDEGSKRVIAEPVELTQNYRGFELESGWQKKKD